MGAGGLHPLSFQKGRPYAYPVACGARGRGPGTAPDPGDGGGRQGQAAHRRVEKEGEYDRNLHVHAVTMKKVK